MKHYSPSSDDSPIDHRHDVKLSDLRYSSHRAAPAAPADTLNMAFARAENKKGLNALSVIHGSQASLRSSIQQERERISRVTEEVQANNSALFQSPKRRPPKPPVHQKDLQQVIAYEPVDYTSVHNTQNAVNARSRLSSLIHRERILRQEIERNANPMPPNRLPRRPAPRPMSPAYEDEVRADNHEYNKKRPQLETGSRRPPNHRRHPTSSKDDQDTDALSDDQLRDNKQRQKYRSISASADGFRKRNLDQVRRLNLDGDGDSDRSHPHKWRSGSFSERSTADEYGSMDYGPGEVPLSSLAVKSLIDNQRGAVQRLMALVAEIRHAKTLEEIALLVGKGCASSSMRNVGIEQCSVWFMKPLVQTVPQQAQLWTRDRIGIVSTEGSLNVPPALSECWRRHNLDARTIGTRHIMTRKDPDCVHVEEFDNYVATLGGLSFQTDADAVRAPIRQDRRYALTGIENWTAVYATDWSSNADLNYSKTEHQDGGGLGGCIVMAVKQNFDFNYLDTSETLFFEHVLSQLSFVVSARAADIFRRQQDMDMEQLINVEKEKLRCARRHLHYSQLFDEAVDEGSISRLLVQAGREVFQHSIMSYLLREKPSNLPEHSNEDTRVFSVIAGAGDTSKQGVVAAAVGQDDPFFGFACKATPASPAVFSTSVSSISTAGLLQYSSIEVFAGVDDLSVLSVAVGPSSATECSVAGGSYLLIVSNGSVLEQRQRFEEYVEMAKHLARWANNAYQRIRHSEETAKKKAIDSVLPSLLLSISNENSDIVINEVNDALTSGAAKVSFLNEGFNVDSGLIVPTPRIAAAVRSLSMTDVATSLGAERCRLLLTDSFLKKNNQTIAADRFSLFGNDGDDSASRNGWRRPVSSEFELVYSFIGGEGVDAVRNSENAAAAPPRWMGCLRQGRCVCIESMYSQPSHRVGHGSADWHELKRLVRAVDPNAVSALLVPIAAEKTSQVLSGVLVLSNKAVSKGGSNEHSFFDKEDRERIDNSELSSSIARYLQTVLLQDLAANISRKYSSDLKLLSLSAEAFRHQASLLHKKNAALRTFSNWKYIAAMRAERNRRESDALLWDRYVDSAEALCRDLLTLRGGLSVESALQRHLKEIFCDDRVSAEVVASSATLSTSSNAWVVSPIKYGKLGLHKAEIDGFISGTLISNELSVHPDSIAFIMSQIRNNRQSLRPDDGLMYPIEFSADELKRWEREGRDITIRVKIARSQAVGPRDRTSAMTQPFSDMEQRVLSTYCRLAGCALQLVNLSEPSLTIANMAVDVVDKVLRQRDPNPAPSEQVCIPSGTCPVPLLHASTSESDVFSSSFASGSSPSSDSTSSSSLSTSSSSLPGEESVYERCDSTRDEELPPLSPVARPLGSVAPQPQIICVYDELCDELLSCLLQTLPALFDGIASADNDTAAKSSRDLYYSLSLWLKRISKGDIALLHIKPSAAISGQRREDDGYISSEDSSATNLFSSELPSSIASLHKFVLEECAVSPASEGNESSPDGSNRRNFLVQLLNGLSGGDLGELKIIYAPQERATYLRDEELVGDVAVALKEKVLTTHGLFQRRKLGVSILSYLLSLSLAIPSKISHLHSEISTEKARAAALEENLAGAMKLIAGEKSLNQGLRGKLSAVLALVVLIEKIGKMPTLIDLARVISDGLPTVLGVESAMLLLPPSIVAKCTFHQNGEEDSLNEVWNVSHDLVAVKDATADSKEAPISWRQLHQVPLYSAISNDVPIQSHIPLASPSNKQGNAGEGSNYGAILILSSQRNDGTNRIVGAFAGLEDYLMSALSTALFSALSDFRHMNAISECGANITQINLMKQQKLQQEVVIAELKERHEEAARCLSAKNDEVVVLQMRLQEHERALDAIRLEISQDRDAIQNSLNETLSAQFSFRQMVSSFIKLSDCLQTKDGADVSVRGTLSWLQDLAHGHGYVLGTVKSLVANELILELLNMPRSNLKVIREDSPDYRSIRSTVLSAASEALRCGDVVECNIDKHRSKDSAASHSDSGLSVTIKSPLADDGTRYSALCVPNKSLQRPDDVSSCLCFVFLKVDDSESERQYDIAAVRHPANKGDAQARELLLCACGLAGRVICSQEMLGGDLVAKHAEIEALRVMRVRQDRLGMMLSEAAAMSSELWLRNIGAVGEVAKALEQYGALLITPTDTAQEGLESDVVTRVILPTKKKSGGSAALKCLHTGLVQRIGLVLYLPIMASLGDKVEAVGVLQVERKFASAKDSADGTEKPVAVVGEDRVSSLTISEDEQTALLLLCRLAVPSFSRISLINDTYVGVEQASRAIESLQEMQEELKSKLADEIASKYLLQDLMKVSTSTISAVISRGASSGEVHNALEKGVVAVLGAQECHVVSSDPSIFVSSDDLAHPQASHEEGAHLYYTLDADKLAGAAVVELQKGDVELITLQTGRPIIFTIGGGKQSAQAGSSGHEEWGSKSWAVRQYLETASGFTQMHSADSNARTMRGSSDCMVGITSSRGIPHSNGGLSAGPLHVMAVPYSVRDGVNAVVVVVRRSTEYSKDDKDCLAHLIKLSTLCMNIDRATVSISSVRRDYEALVSRADADRLQTEESIRRQLDVAVETVYLGNDGFDDSAVVREATLSVLTDISCGSESTSSDRAFSFEAIETFSKMVFGRETQVELRGISESDFQMLASSKLPVISSSPVLRKTQEGGDLLPETGVLRLHSVTSYYWVDVQQNSVVFISKPRGSDGGSCCMVEIHLNQKSNHKDTQILTAALARIKLMFLLRMLSLQLHWTTSLSREVKSVLADKAAICANLQAKCQDLTELCAQRESDKENQFEEWNKQYEEVILHTKDRYKSIIFDRSRSHKLTEMFFKTAIKSCVHALEESSDHSHKSNKSSRKNSKAKDAVLSNSATALLKVLVKACGDMAIGMSTRICYCKSASSLISPTMPVSGTVVGSGEPISVTGPLGGVAVTWVDTSSHIHGKKAKSYRPGSSSAAKDRSVVGPTHPIYLCMALNSYVLIARSDDQPEVLDDIQRYQASSNSIPVIVCRSEEYAHGTLFIPVAAPQSEMHKLRVYFAIIATPAIMEVEPLRHGIVKSPGKVQDSTFNWQVSLKNLIFCWNSVRETCSALAILYESNAFEKFCVERAKRREAAVLFSMVYSRSRQSALKDSFSLWKQQQAFDYKLSLMAQNYAANEAHVLFKVSVLEQAVADWAEIVKSVNTVAAGSLSQGLRGVWAQACVPFMSLMSSNVEVLGCGLLIANHLDDILELSVKDTREADTSRADGNISGSSLKDGNSDTIRIRNASELGAGVLALTWNIISGNMDERGSAGKRLWKLNKQNTLGVFNDGGEDGDNNFSEQMWLVPVRTAWAVIGVLRLSVRSAAPKTVDDYFDPDVLLRDADLDINHQIEQAKRNMINFAEVVAPIILAARQIDVATSKENDMAGSMDVFGRRERAAVTEARVSMLKARLIARVTLDVCSVMDTFTMRDIEDLQDDVVEKDRNTRNNSIFTGGSDTPGGAGFSALKRQLEQTMGTALGHTVVISVNEMRGSATATGTTDSQQMTDYMVRQDDAEKGGAIDALNVTQVGPIQPESITELIKNDVGDVLGTVTLIIRDIHQSNGAAAVEHPNAASSLDMSDEAVALHTVMPIVAKLLHSALLSVERRKETNMRIASMSDLIFGLESNIANSTSYSESVVCKERAATESAKYYQTLSDISSQCLSINAAITNYLGVRADSDDMNSELLDEIFENEEHRRHLFDDRGRGRHRMVLANTGLLLSRFCEKIEESTDWRCSFRFGLLTRDHAHAVLDDGELLTSEDVRIMYYHGSSRPSDGPFFVPSDKNMGAGGPQLVNNLAIACVTSMIESSVDVSFSVPTADGKEFNILRIGVLTIPLASTRASNKRGSAESHSLGVLQVFIPSSEEKKDEVVNIGEEVAAAVSATLTNITMLRELAGQLDKLSKISIDVQGAAEQAHFALDFWKSRAKQWQGVGMMCCSVVKGFASGAPLVKTLLMEDTLEHLSRAGISLVQLGKNAQKLELSGKDSATSSDAYATASMTVPLSSSQRENEENDSNSGNNAQGGERDVVIEISCSSVAPPPDKSSAKARAVADKHAEDMISLVGSLIQSVEYAIRTSNSAAREASSRYRAAEMRADRLSADIENIKRESQDIVLRDENSKSELSKKLELDTRFNKFSIGFVNSVIIPAVRQVVGSLEQLVQQYHSDTLKLRPQLSDVDVKGSSGDASGRKNQVDLRAALTLDRVYTSIAVSCDRAISNLINQQLGLGEPGSVFLNPRESSRAIWKKIVESTTTDVAVPVYFHASVVVRRDRTRARTDDADGALATPNPKYALYDGSTGSHCLISEKDVSRAFSKEHHIQRQCCSVMEKCFHIGGVQSIDMPVEDVMLGSNFSYVDLLGIDVSTITILLSTSVGNASSDGPSTARLRVCCVPLGGMEDKGDKQSEPYRAPAVVRCVWVEAWAPHQDGDSTSIVVKPVTAPILPNLLELLSSNASGVLRWLSELAIVEDKLYTAETELKSINVVNEKLEDELSRCRRLYRVVARESTCLFDPPLGGGGMTAMMGLQTGEQEDGANPSVNRFTHPAYLAPVAATQDTCLKFLHIVRSLVRTEGQAILLVDIDTLPMSYQVISTGDALKWPGISHGVFGKVYPTGSGTSLVESVAKSHKAIVVPDILKDSRHLPQVDGSCAPHTPGLVIPLRGRGGVVIGAVIAARGANGNEFSVEDVTAVDLAATMSSLSLYWCRGLGSVHVQLEKSLSRMIKLEHAVQSLRGEGGEKKFGQSSGKL